MLIITFSTTDLFIFYLGFEGLSIPVFFLIFLYGAEITKIKASIYFIIYSFLSSVCMGISIFLLYSQFGTTNIYKITQLLQINLNSFTFNDEIYLISQNSSIITNERFNLIWILLFLSFIIKLPLVPFHM